MKKEKFVKFNGGWWKIKGDIIVNPVGGWCPFTCVSEEDKKTIVEMDGFDSFPVEQVIDGVYNNMMGPYGWINIQGQFFGCDPTFHAMQAREIHHLSEIQLENFSWIKIYKNPKYGRPDFILPKHRITKQQLDTLTMFGYHPDVIDNMHDYVSYLDVIDGAFFEEPLIN